MKSPSRKELLVLAVIELSAYAAAIGVVYLVYMLINNAA